MKIGGFVGHLALASLSIAVSGCGSQGSSLGMPAMLQQTQHSPTAAVGQLIYVANPPSQYVHVGSIVGFADSANGNVVPNVRIAGKRTGLGYDATSIAVDKLGRLYTTGSDDQLGVVFIWPSGSNGNVKPVLHFSVCGSFTAYPMTLAVDRADHLWVGCREGSEEALLEFAAIPAGASHLNRIQPLRVFLGENTGIIGPTAIALNPLGQASVENVNRKIVTFAANQSGNVTPISQLRGDKTELDGQGGIGYDSQGRLIACTNRQHKPRILTFAPGANGNISPISTLSVAGCKGIAIDRQGNIYVTSAESITEYAAGASGSAQPLRVISGALTTLSNASSVAF